MEEEVVGLLPRCARGGIELHSQIPRSNRGEGMYCGKEVGGQLGSRGHPAAGSLEEDWAVSTVIS